MQYAECLQKYYNAVDGTFDDDIKDKTIKRDDIRQKQVKVGYILKYLGLIVKNKG